MTRLKKLLNLSFVFTGFLFLSNSPLANEKQYAEKRPQPILKKGQHIFHQRCELCHGSKGEGNGRMIKVVKAPPPADLTSSRLPDDYLTKIIAGGGRSVQRSSQMPPWGDELSEQEILAVIEYIKSIRD